MFGILLAVIGALLNEASIAIGKAQIKLKKESIYIMGFLSSFWAAIWFLGVILYKNEFNFSLHSLPTFIPRLVLEIILAHISIVAVIGSDRSSYSFIRVLTLPLLLITDLWLGYSFNVSQILALVAIISSLFLIAYNKGINRKGMRLVFATAVLAAITISLYKYDIAHFNSVEAEQGVIGLALLIYFFFGSFWVQKANPFRYLFKYPFSIQSFAVGFASVLGSFAYIFAPATIISSAERSSSILWAVLSGNLYFKERRIGLKLAVLFLLSLGIVLLVNW
jgi:drug/metabolite transporter (DMT)-like permease